MAREEHVFRSNNTACSQLFLWLPLSKWCLYNIYWLPEQIVHGSALSFPSQFSWMALDGPTVYVS